MYKYFFVILAISTVILSIALAVTYKFSERLIIDQTQEKSIEQLEQVRSVFNAVHYSNIPAAVQLSEDRLVNALMYSRDLTRSEIIQAIGRLDTAKLSNSLISSITVYNHLRSMYYSTKGGASQIDSFYDAQLIRILKQAKSYGLYRYIPRKINGEAVFTLLLGSVPITGTQLKGALVTNISEGALRSLFTSSTAESTGDLIVYDRNGMVLSHPNPEMFALIDSETPYLQRIIDGLAERGAFITEVGKEKKLLTFIRHADFGWIFVNLSPYEVILSNIHSARNRVLFVLAIMFVISVLVVYVTSRRLYKPIGLIQDFAEQVENTYFFQDGQMKMKNELEYVDTVFHRLFMQTQNLNSYVDTHKKRSMRQAVRNIVLSGTCEETIELNRPFQVIVARIDKSVYVHREYKYGQVMSLLRSYAQTIQKELSLRYPVATIEPDQCAFFLSIEERPSDITNNIKFEEDRSSNDAATSTTKGVFEKDKETLLSKLEAMCEWSNGNVCLQFTLGVGSVVESLDEAPISYHNALTAVNNRFKYGTRRVIPFFEKNSMQSVPGNLTFDAGEVESDNSESKSIEAYRFPQMKVERLIKAIRIGESEEGLHILYSIFEDVRNYTYEDFLLLTHLLVYHMQISFEPNKYPQGEFALNKIRMRINTYETIEEAEECFSKAIKSLCSEASSSACKKTKKLAEKARKLIEEKLTDSNLCSKMLGDELCISTNYLRTIFREYYGMSVSDFINQARIEQTKRLLHTTDVPVKELYLKMGFNNYNYFFTLFKKHTGVTPIQYKRRQGE